MAFTLAPALCSLLLNGADSRRGDCGGPAYGLHRCAEMGLSNQAIVIGMSVVVLVCRPGLPFLGGEFMPALEEGNLWVRATMPVDISFEQAARLTGQMRSDFSNSRKSGRHVANGAARRRH